MHPCRCDAPAIERYRNKISGPLLDRIDIHLEVPAVPYGDLTADQAAESSAVMRNRVEAARDRQRSRFRGQVGIHANAHMTSRDVRRHCPVAPPVEALLSTAVSRFGLSARAYHRILKIGRTVADLAGAEALGPEHVGEAIQYRTLDRKRESV